jgi:uncharacterized protein (DUF169 family)
MLNAMINYAEIEKTITGALGLTKRPVAIAFRDQTPAGVKTFTGSQPSGCSFWQLAAEGQVFSTAPADHHNCPIGSYTHNIPLPKEREQELPQTLGLMAEIGYIRMEEVGGIPQLAKTPAATVYAPLGDTPIDPDAVLVAGRPGSLMLLQEAALRAGSSLQPLFGRPTCMAIPAALAGPVVSSLGCVGNRIYTGLAADELYTVIPGGSVEAIADQLATITSANQALTEYHTGRVAALRM